jgi:Calx-beta domain
MTRGKFFFLHAILVWAALQSATHVSAQLTINNAVNASDGVTNVLLGAGVTVSNITFSGTPQQIGSFNCAGGCNLNISSGLVLGSGNIDQTPGNSGGATSLGPASGWGASDADLEELSGYDLNDAAVLEFDFVAVGSTVSFNFVFGSDEYPEFVNGGFNDAFGFFLSGPGITGPYTNNAANIALIPNTNTPVTIDNVNSGLNSTYYVNNNNTVGNNNVIECDGFTTVLTASTDVQCGQSYHIKIAIGDAVDTSYDSFVFLEGNSFTSNNLSASLASPSLAPPGGGLYEGCQSGNIVFNVPELTTPQVFQLAYTGSATYGVDYDSIPTQIVFPANQSQLVLNINALTDAVLEGNETLTVTILGATSCGQNVDVDVVISDLPNLVVNIPDVPINCGQQAVLTPTISGGLGNYVVSWQNGPTNPSYTVSPSLPTSYNFTVTDTCGVPPFNGVANVVFIDNPPITVFIGPDQALTCLDNVVMNATISGGFGTYDYAWTANGVPIGTTTSINYSTVDAAQIILTVTDDCGESSSDLANVSFPPLPMNVNLGPDMAVTCIEENILQPTVTGGVGTYTYTWYTQAGTIGSAPTLPFMTDEDISVAVIVEDQCGNEGEDEIDIAVPQVAITADIGNDLTITCIDEVPVIGI